MGIELSGGPASYDVRRGIALVKSGETRGSPLLKPAEVAGSANSSANSEGGITRTRKLLLGRYAMALRQAILEERFEHARNLLDAIDEALGSVAPVGRAARARH